MTKNRIGTLSIGALVLIALPAVSVAAPPGKTPRDVVGIDIACSNDHVYVWYRDGTVSSGTTEDLDQYRAPYGL